MRPTLYFNSVLIAVCILLLGACQANGGRTADLQLVGRSARAGGVPPVITGLPAPRDLPAPPARHSAAYTEDDLIRRGGEFSTALPHDNVTGSPGHPAQFNPDWTPSPGGLDGLAFCIFDFTVDGYDREPELNYGWTAPDTSPADCYIAVANWDTNRWDWFADEGEHLELDDTAPYFDAGGRMLVIFALAGQSAASLNFVRLGHFTVMARLNVTPAAGYVPFTATLNASASSAGAGTINLYDWDFNGDGTNDDETTDPTVTHEYTQPGNVRAAVTVTTSYGVQAAVSADLATSSGWAHSWGRADSETALDVAVDRDSGAVYACGLGNELTSGNGADVCLTKFDAQGNLLWARGWGGAGSEVARCIGIDNSGNVYTAGYTDSFGAGGHDVLVQKWNPDGTLAWSRTWGNSELNEAAALAVNGDFVYVIGTSLGFGSDADLLVLNYNTDGDRQWSETFSGLTQDYGKGVVVRKPTLFSDPVVYVCGDSNSFGTDSDLVYVTLSLDGEILSFYTAAVAGKDLKATSIAATGEYTGYHLYVSGTIGASAAVKDPLVVRFGVSETARVWSDNMYAPSGKLAINGDTIYLASQVSPSGTDHAGVVARFSTDLALESLLQWGTLSQGSAFTAIALIPSGGLVLAGQGQYSDGLEWKSGSGNFDAQTVDWVSQSEDAISRNADEGSPTAQSYAITDYTLDSGGGGQDLAVAAISLP